MSFYSYSPSVSPFGEIIFQLGIFQQLEIWQTQGILSKCIKLDYQLKDSLTVNSTLDFLLHLNRYDRFGY